MSASALAQTHITIIIVPRTDQATINLRVPVALLRALIWFAVLGLTAAVAAALIFVNRHRQLAVTVDELQELRKVNAIQQAHIEALVGRAQALEGDLVRIKELDDEIRLLITRAPDDAVTLEAAGATDSAATPGPAPALGGPSLPAPGGRFLQLLSPPIAAVGRSTATPSRSSPRVSVGGGAAAAREATGRLVEVQAEVQQRLPSLFTAKDSLTELLVYLNHRPALIPTAGEISSGFGWRWNPFGWGRQFHRGIDIAAPFDAPIVAPGAGTVVFAGWKDSYGRAVIIDHGYGLTTLYSHNSTITVAVGDRVTRGQVIASVGMSGEATGPHLHYEVYVNGVAVNPMTYIKPPGSR